MKFSDRLAAAALVVLLAGFPAVQALADDQQKETQLETTVVTATLTETPVRELGVAATVITAEDIERRQATHVLELLQEVPGFNMSQTGSRGGLSELRVRGGEADYALVLIDGVQVNDGGGHFDFATLSTDNIERIEIIRGPQSALYGSDAIGGVINIITKKGTGAPLVKLSTAGGLRDNGHYQAEHKAGFTFGREQGGVSLAYGRSDDEGVVDFVNSGFRSNVFSGRFDLHPTDRWDFTFTTRLEDTRFEYPSEAGGDRIDRLVPGLDPDQNNEETDFVAGARLRVDATDWWEHVLHYGHHTKDNDNHDPADPETSYDYMDSLSNYTETRDSIDYHWNFYIPKEGPVQSTLTVGFEYEDESYSSISTGSYTSNCEADRDNMGYYMQEQLTLFDRLHLVGGFRLEDNSEFGTEIVPRGSVAFEIFETDTKLRAAVGEGFKEPSFFENFGGGYVVGNPDLDPEKSFSWEVGIDQYFWDDRITLSFTYFNNEYEDLITYVTTLNSADPNYLNIQGAESQGLEFEARVRPGYGLTLGASYTYLDTEVTDDGGLNSVFFAEGKKLLRRPEHQFGFFVDWAWEGLKIHVNTTWVGERDDGEYRALAVSPYFSSTRIENDAYFLLDIAASYLIDVDAGPLSQIKIFGKANNLTDEEYEEVYGYKSEGINGFLGVQFILGGEG